jgi:non-specific serine/threonine protein kinase/serine/threonine-protein kinase
MHAERWERVRSIFSAALDCDTLERPAFVASACTHDHDLQAEIESLLAAHAGADGFLEGSALDVVPSPHTPVDYSVCDFRVGAYRIVREIGRGGMGAVYLAERADDQYHKRVATKIVTRGLDTDLLVRRFRHERQILADLDHPNIARLLDGGTTDDGLPYLVMEHIEGEPITRYCSTHRLGLPDRLALFRNVCAAVQYAHQHLIVHCDIKPGNILVTEDGVPKLLDFGIARLLSAVDDDASDAAPARAMTPAYASPEQVAGAAVTTLTDVYSLGAVLAELLPDAQPIGPTATRASRPSPRHDLYCIAAKASESAPERRYASAQQLSEDIRRYLDKRSVIARPPTFAYRSIQLLRRNALACAAGAVVFIALLAGIGATTWQARIAEQQRGTADRRFREVRSLAVSLIGDVNDSMAVLPGATHVRHFIVTRALNALNTLARDPHTDQGVQYELAGAYIKAGDLQGKPSVSNLGETGAALDSYNRARAILSAIVAAHPRDARAESRLALVDERIGAIYRRSRDWVKGEQYVRLAVAINEALVRSGSANVSYQDQLAGSLMYLGDALTASDDQWSIARVHAAQSSYERALEIRERLAHQRLVTPELQRGLLVAYERLGYAGEWIWKQTGHVAELRAALADHLQSQRIRLALLAADPGSASSQRLVADGWMNIAQAQQMLGEIPRAVASCDSAGPVFLSLANVDPTNAEASRDLAYFHENFGSILADAGQPSRAIQHERVAVTMLSRLQRADTADKEDYYHVEHAQEIIARGFETLGATASAQNAYADVVATLRRWIAAEPGNAEKRRQMLRDAVLRTAGPATSRGAPEPAG